MRIVFWQNCLSPHQLPYIVHLLDDERVDEIVVVADETVSGARKEMGWSVAQYDGLDRCKVYVHPHDKIIESLFDDRQSDSQHLFSGIRMDRFVFKCLQLSLAYHIKRGIITERPIHTILSIMFQMQSHIGCIEFAFGFRTENMLNI